jgi:excisionase family DNA binding protein
MDDSAMTISIGEAAEILGVSVKTVRRWTDAGKLRTERSPSGHRRYNLHDLKRCKPKTLAELEDRITINYARVSSHAQKEDLKRQVKMLEQFAASHGWQFETIQDLGSGFSKFQCSRNLIDLK